MSSGTGGPPTVLVIQSQPWSSLLQFSALLRRHGCRVVWISDPRSRNERVLARLIFDETQSWSTFMAEGYRDPTIIDIQGSEYDISALAPLLDDTQTPDCLARVIRHKLAMLDKFEMSRRLRAAGVPVPDALAASDTSPALAVEQLGLPVVVKQRVGAGGQGVRIVNNIEDLVEEVSRLGAERLYFERLCSGEMVQYAAAYAGEHTWQRAVMRSVKEDHTLAPASGFFTVGDAGLMDLGAATTAAVNGAGLINVDLVHSQSGDAHVVDVNLRAWDSLVALRSAGIDFAEGYLCALDVRRTKPTREHPVPGRLVEVFPSALFRRVAMGDTRRAVRVFVSQGWRYGLWLGPRYLLLTAWMFAIGLRQSRRAGDAGPDRDAEPDRSRRIWKVRPSRPERDHSSMRT